VKKLLYSAISILGIFILIALISNRIFSIDKMKLDHELIFYNDGDDYFYKSNDGIKKINTQGWVNTNGDRLNDIVDQNNVKNNNYTKNDTFRISMIKYNGKELYLTGENADLWKINFNLNSISKVSEAIKKPVDYNDSLKRSIVGYDENTGITLYEHEIMLQSDLINSQGRFNLKKIYSNLSINEQFYSLASYKNHVYVGTAVNGLYVSTSDSSKIKTSGYLHFTSLNSGLPFIPFDGSIRFYEEIHTLHISKQGDILVGTGIQGGVFLKTANQKKFQALSWPEKWKTSDVYLITTGHDQTIWVSCTQGMIVYTKDGDLYKMENISWSEFSYTYHTFLIQSSTDSDLYAYYLNSSENIKPEKSSRMKTASLKKLFYSSPFNLKIKPALIKTLLTKSNYDGIVIDVKDDRGHVLYNSNVPFINEIGAKLSIMDLSAFVKMAHEYNKYVAVRIVVFKDPVLFEQPGFAIWNSSNDQPWIGNEKERWVDPFNPSIAEKYYVPLVKELTSLGVDEIQLDYIRFPSDGPIYQCLFRSRTPGKYFSEAIEDFLFKIRQATSLPISLDIYGYQGLYRTGGAIGQDMLALGQFSDVISPMLYSSHFGNEYMTDRKKEDRVYELIKHSIRRAEFIANDQFLIRPYLQAFPMKSAIWGYGVTYFNDQIRASKEENASGYSFWGSIDHMLAVDNAINELK